MLKKNSRKLNIVIIGSKIARRMIVPMLQFVVVGIIFCLQVVILVYPFSGILQIHLLRLIHH
jgi:hypothetical protein